MPTLRSCLQFLDEHQIAYQHTRHPHAYGATEVASAECIPARSFAKAIVFEGNTGFAIAALPASCEINLEDLESCLDFGPLRLASEVELARLFPGCEVGAMPPLGVLFGLPVFVDERLAAEEFICFNAGTHRDAIHMSFEDFAGATHPILLRFAHMPSKVH